MARIKLLQCRQTIEQRTDIGDKGADTVDNDPREPYAL